MSMNTHQMAEAGKMPVSDADNNRSTARDGGAKKRVEAPSERANKLLGQYMEMIKRSLGNKVDPLEFANAIVNAVATDPNLLKAMDENPKSFVGAVCLSAIVGLIPNTPLGYAYLVPYFAKDKVASAEHGREVKRWQVNFQIGYMGVLELVRRSGEVGFVNAEVVYEKDFFDYMMGTERWIKHRPYDGADAGRPVKFYAQYKLKNGEDNFKVWNYEKVVDHAVKFSKSYDSRSQSFYGPWQNNFESMAKKTVLLDLLKLAPKSAKVAGQLAADNTTKTIPANGADTVNMLMMPNEDYEPQVEIGNNDVAQLEVKGNASETAENVRKAFGLKRGSEVKVKQSEMELDPEDVK